MTDEDFEAWRKYFDLVLPSCVGDGAHPDAVLRLADELATGAAELVRERMKKTSLPDEP